MTEERGTWWARSPSPSDTSRGGLRTPGSSSSELRVAGEGCGKQRAGEKYCIWKESVFSWIIVWPKVLQNPWLINFALTSAFCSLKIAWIIYRLILVYIFTKYAISSVQSLLFTTECRFKMVDLKIICHLRNHKLYSERGTKLFSEYKKPVGNTSFKTKLLKMLCYIEGLCFLKKTNIPPIQIIYATWH